MKLNTNANAAGDRKEMNASKQDLDQNKTQQANKAGQNPPNQKITDEDLNPRADENEEEDDADDQQDDSNDFDTDKDRVEKTDQSKTNPQAEKPGMRNSGESRREQR